MSPVLDRLIQRTVTVLGEQQVQTIWAGRLDFRARDFTREFDFGLLELEDSRWYVRPASPPWEAGDGFKDDTGLYWSVRGLSEIDRGRFTELLCRSFP